MEKQLVSRLREKSLYGEAAARAASVSPALWHEFARTGVKFAASSQTFENMHREAVRQLFDCLAAAGNGKFVLLEGGVYHGAWLESTGTINAEILSRFLPSVAAATFELFADGQRADGWMPYKWTPDGPAYRQIQLVTPLARSVWNHYRLNGGQDRRFLAKMYEAMRRFDAWLEQHRNTRGTGCVEAFCAFDTGHDLSPRFWHVPDTPHLDDAARFDPDSPLLPFLAPDLTANAACQRSYLARIAEELGPDSGSSEPGATSAAWREKSRASLSALMRYCYDEEDQFFYDVDRNGSFVRIQSDVLLRVLACEVGDRTFFEQALRRYLLNTRKFFAKYPFTSIAMDDPRFDPFSDYNTWAGATNFLSLLRAPHAFEHHRRFVELTWVMQPILSALARAGRFPQCLSPWTGQAGFTDTYSPAILCSLDYVERLCGIMPRPDGEIWFTGLTPYAMDHGRDVGMSTAYARIIDGVLFELVNGTEHSAVYRAGELLYRFPRGIRAITDRTGKLQAIVGMTVRPVSGLVEMAGQSVPFRVQGNEELAFSGGSFERIHEGGVTPPRYE